MKISKKILEDQKVLSFEDLMVRYISLIACERSYSDEKKGPYLAVWEFIDGSKVTVDDFVFSELGHRS